MENRNLSMDPDIELLEKYFLDRFPARFDLQSQLSLLFLLIGEKPGAMIMFMEESKEEILQEFCTDFNLEFQKQESEIHRIFYITVDEKYFDLLEPVDEEKPYYTKKSKGKFLGYPADAVDFFIQNSGNLSLRDEMREKIDRMIENKELTEENSYLIDLVMFTPKLTDQGIQEAVEIGERRRELLRQFDRQNNTELGEKIIGKVFDRSKPYFRTF